jgi:hypothetical protein
VIDDRKTREKEIQTTITNPSLHAYTSVCVLSVPSVLSRRLVVAWFVLHAMLFASTMSFLLYLNGHEYEYENREKRKNKKKKKKISFSASILF